MSLPYQSATAGKNALVEIEKILREFGCCKFATGSDWNSGEIFIQFEHRGRRISLSASAQGYAAAWLRENPYTSRRRCTEAEHREKALETGGVAVYSILRDWIKGQTAAIETGVLSFEGAFLAYMQLPNGRTVLEEAESRKMLEPPSEEANK